MNKNLIFLHIPKAAGTTMRAVIRRQYPPEQRHAITTSPSVHRSLAEFREFPLSKLKRIRYVAGHGTFGLHELLPDGADCVTMLRDPVERVVSNYYYVRRSPAHRLYSNVVGRGMSLREYVVSGVNSHLDNQMTRQVAGVNDDMYTDDVLKQAKKHLRDHFAVAGLVKRFDDSLLLMKRRFGWGDVSYRKRNATHERPRKENLSDEVIRIIENHNRLDKKLYSYVEQRLEQKIAEVNLDWEKRKLHFHCWLRSSKARLKENLKQRFIKPHTAV